MVSLLSHVYKVLTLIEDMSAFLGMTLLYKVNVDYRIYEYVKLVIEAKIVYCLCFVK